MEFSICDFINFSLVMEKKVWLEMSFSRAGNSVGGFRTEILFDRFLFSTSRIKNKNSFIVAEYTRVLSIIREELHAISLICTIV